MAYVKPVAEQDGVCVRLGRGTVRSVRGEGVRCIGVWRHALRCALALSARKRAIDAAALTTDSVGEYPKDYPNVGLCAVRNTLHCSYCILHPGMREVARELASRFNDG